MTDNPVEFDTFTEFVMKALRTLQLQNDGLRELVEAHEERIQVLDKQILWNLYERNIEQYPSDMYVRRNASGRLCVSFTEANEEVETI